MSARFVCAIALSFYKRIKQFIIHFPKKYIDKWNTHKLENVLENETYTILWHFEIQTIPLIPAKRPDLVSVIKDKKDFALKRLYRSRS